MTTSDPTSSALPKPPPELIDAGWESVRGGKAIVKTFRFRNFRDAAAWMTRIAFEAEAANHHPEWFNVYNRVEVTLTTHDTDCLTEKDIALAEKMERIAASFLPAATN